MTVEFNRLNNYTNYNINIGQKALEKTNEEAKKEEVKETEPQVSLFKGLENETDLLTQNAQNIYGVKIGKYTSGDKDIADKTNEILAGLGYNYKVNPAQVASVSKSLNEVILPEMKPVADAAVAAHIQDPNGPFADLFA